MAFFKFRLPGQGDKPGARGRNPAASPNRARASEAGGGQGESVEALRTRARHRVIGAAVLVVLAVIGFPMLFDTQPRPVAVDVPIEIPERGDDVPARSDRRSTAEPTVVAERVLPAESLDPSEEVVPASVAASSLGEEAVERARVEREKAEAAAKEKAEREKAERVAQADAEKAQREKAAAERAKREKADREKAAKAKAEREKTDREKAAKAKAEREKADREKAQREKADKAKEAAEAKRDDTKRDDAAAEKGRFVVQIGSFEDESKAREARMKAERGGISTYIQVVNTKDGKRTRVRVGPYPTRAEAEAVAKKVKALGLYAGIAAL